MTPKEELIQAIERWRSLFPEESSDEVVQQVLSLLKAIEQPSSPNLVQSHLQSTVLERMGGVPEYLLTNGNLSDRDRRRDVIAMRLQQKYRQNL